MPKHTTRGVIRFHIDPFGCVNNLFDKEPPIIASNYGGTNGNTYVETYDPVGRRIFMSATLQF